MIGLGNWGKNIYRNLEKLNVLKKIYDSNNENLNNIVTSQKKITDNADEIILSTDKGSIMRCAVKEIRIAGRNTQGVRIKKLSGVEKVVSVIKIEDNIK